MTNTDHDANDEAIDRDRTARHCTPWQPIETAPRECEFLATDGTLLGVGSHYRRVEPAEVTDTSAWSAFYEKVHAPFRPQFDERGNLPVGFSLQANFKAERAAWEAAKDRAPPHAKVPNPKAGEVEEWFYAHAFLSFDCEAETCDCDGPAFFRPSYWMPLPGPPEGT